MRRTNWKTVSTLVTMIVIAGCQENIVSAPQSSSVAPVSMMMAPEGAPRLSLIGSYTVGNNNEVEFTVTPAGGVFFVGNHAVVFPARSICDPEKSRYGPGTWDSPCEPLSKPLKIHASVRTAKLGTWVDFSPSLRFVPSNNSNKWVWMYMYTPGVVGARDLSKFAIMFAPTIGADGIDETSSDATLRTYVDTRGGVTSRRIKHFTGYMTSSGRTCDPSSESDCYPNGSRVTNQDESH
ncbi:MAG: hypothetical protein ABIT20_20430 [Gemmatimonadaceae bacterium]